MIIQAIRDAERERQTKEYEDKKEEIITAVVYKVDISNGNLVLDTGTGYATLIRDEQIPGEVHEVGDRLKVFISEVKIGEMRGPIVTLSRTHPNFVKRLFELEVPEIADGTVAIKSVSREAGVRTKIAVYSNDENVDAVGACIGKNSMRISAILNEIGNEKIDIIKYSDNLGEFVSASLAPAKVISVYEEQERSYKVTVSPDQLSLAIGKEGLNAKLAARLTGCKIDIKA
jgi:N utilization substance protein A